jgi:acetylornithine deacetylase/succinyl-diaminopimelate desuccinylase-like protein
MEGRATATAGSARAARFIANQLRSYGVAPAGDSAYYQRVPLTVGLPGPGGRRRLTLRETVPSDTVPMERRTTDVNVVGMIAGSDPSLRDEVIVVGAHFDHLGVGRVIDSDSIYNGADDDASGVVATLEIARALAQGPPPRRTVIFVLSTGEETGLLGMAKRRSGIPEVGPRL